MKAEKSISIELGWSQIFSEYIGADLALYTNDYKDLIEADTLKGNFQFQNITKARISGLELNIFGRAFNKKLQYNLGYTYTYARDTDNDVYLTFRPRNLLYISVNGNLSFLDIGIDYSDHLRLFRLCRVTSPPL